MMIMLTMIKWRQSLLKPRKLFQALTLALVLAVFVAPGPLTAQANEYRIVNESAEKVRGLQWVGGEESSAISDVIRPGEGLTWDGPGEVCEDYYIAFKKEIWQFSNVDLREAQTVSISQREGVPLLLIQGPSGQPVVEVTGLIEPIEGAEGPVTPVEDLPKDKRPDAEGLFDYAQFPRGMLIEEVDQMINGRSDIDDNGIRELPLRFAGLVWTAKIFEYAPSNQDGSITRYRGDIRMSADLSPEALDKALGAVYDLGFRPVQCVDMAGGTSLDFREEPQDDAEKQKSLLREKLHSALAAPGGRMNCILVKNERFEEIEGSIFTYPLLAVVIRLKQDEGLLQITDTTTLAWVDLAYM